MTLLLIILIVLLLAGVAAYMAGARAGRRPLRRPAGDDPADRAAGLGRERTADADAAHAAGRPVDHALSGGLTVA